MSDRFKTALRKVWRKIEQAEWVFGQLGKKNSDNTYTFVVPGRSTFVYVTMRNASGAQTTVPARNDAGVPHMPKLAVKMKLEQGVYVIYGKSGRQDLALNPPLPPDGTEPHDHSHSDLDDLTSDDHVQYHNDERGDVRYYPRTGYVAESSGVDDAGKPILLDGDGQIDPSFLDITGAQGGYGGNSMEYVFSTTITDSDPGSGIVRFNHGTFSSITQLFLDDLNSTAADVQVWLAALDDSTNTIKGQIRIFKKSDSNIFRIFDITGTSIEATGYWKVLVTPVVSSGTLVDTDEVVISFVRSGNIGATGTAGTNGTNGATGAQGIYGGDSLEFNFSTTITDSDPGSGNLRFNQNQPDAVQYLYIDDLDALGRNASAWLLPMVDATGAIKGSFRVFKIADSSVYSYFHILATVEDSTGYWKFNVLEIAKNGTFTNGDRIVLTYTRAGDKGDTGNQGSFGGFSQQMQYSTTTTDSDPGQGFIRFNHATFASITQIFIDDANTAADDIQAWIATFDDSTNTVKGHLMVRPLDAASGSYFLFNVTGISVEATGYWKILVTPVISSGSMGGSTYVVVSFTRAGDGLNELTQTVAGDKTFTGITTFEGAAIGIQFKSGGATINDDAVHTIDPAGSNGMMLIWSTSLVANTALVHWRTSSPALVGSLVSGANVNVTSGVLTGTSGVDGKLTISAHTDGLVYINNRLGGAASWEWIFFG